MKLQSQVLHEPGKTPESKSYVWLMRSGNDGLPPIVYYRYAPSRSGDVAAELTDGITSEYKTVDKPTFGFLGWKDVIASETADGSDLDIEMIGVCTDICVVSNALILKAMYPEATVRVDAGCCAGVTPEAHAAALVTMRACQVDIIDK